jgi:hypothetical protein
MGESHQEPTKADMVQGDVIGAAPKLKIFCFIFFILLVHTSNSILAVLLDANCDS